MKQGSGLPDWMRNASSAGCLLLLASVLSWSQQPSPSGPSSQSDSTAAAIRDLQQQVKELRSAVSEMRSETEQYRAENAALRRELQSAGKTSASLIQRPPASSYESAAPADPSRETANASPVASPTSTTHSLSERVASLEELSQLLN